ncbi:26S proteasome non-ATPase regulatory subunit 4 [Tanacetum coccineum]
MEAESIMIVVDNSHYVPRDGDMFKTQFETSRLYCRSKFKSNPKTRVGVATLGCGADLWPPSPDSDIEHFLTHRLEHIPWGGEFSILIGLQRSQLSFARVDPEEDIKRRMLVFVAGPCHGYLTEYILKIGKRLKENNIALDVVSFPHQDQEFDALKTITLRSFVAAANNNKDNNSHFPRVPRHSSVRKILVRSNILSPSEAAAVPLTEEEIKKKKNKKMWERIRRKKNRHSQDLENNSQDLEKHSQDSQDLEEHSENLEEEALSSSRPPVIFPDYLQVPE